MTALMPRPPQEQPRPGSTRSATSVYFNALYIYLILTTQADVEQKRSNHPPRLALSGNSGTFRPPRSEPPMRLAVLLCLLAAPTVAAAAAAMTPDSEKDPNLWLEAP